MYKYNYQFGEYVHKKNADGEKLYFVGCDNRYRWGNLPCVYLTTDKDDLSNTNAWMRWKPDGIVSLA